MPSVSAQLPNQADTNKADLTRQFIEKMRADPNYMFKIPLQFYGKVVDEEGNPVADADVGFSWNQLKSNDGLETGRAVTKSDGGGLFSLEEGHKSNGLSVDVSKPGYYTVRADQSSFEYAQPYQGSFLVPDSKNPVLFHLRKKGKGVVLVNSQYGIRDDFGFAMPTNGVPIKVNLLERKVGDGPLEVSQIKPDHKVWKQATEWAFKMVIPDGGFVEYQNEEFPFLAPETGYQPVVEFDFKKGQGDWVDGIKRDYYIKFGTPPVYGRLHVETQIDRDGARLTYAINPDGTRNLEPQ